VTHTYYYKVTNIGLLYGPKCLGSWYWTRT